jgi:hypothetical protein
MVFYLLKMKFNCFIILINYLTIIIIIITFKNKKRKFFNCTFDKSVLLHVERVP